MAPDQITIMLPFDRAPASIARLDIVKALAQQFGARVVGAMACEHSPVLYYETGVLPFDPIEEVESASRGSWRTAKRSFAVP
jgi:hypothetical protein